MGSGLESREKKKVLNSEFDRRRMFWAGFGRIKGSGLESREKKKVLGSELLFLSLLSTARLIRQLLTRIRLRFQSSRLLEKYGFCSMNMGLMERLSALKSGISFDKKVSVMQYRATIYWNILVQIAYSIENAKIIDCESYMLLHRIFDEFASLWVSMKVYAKSKSDYETQQYKFKSLSFQIESVIEVEIPTLANSSAIETFSEWQEFSSEEKSIDKMESSEECEILDEEWKHLEESILSNVVHIHNQLFGSADLVQAPGTFQVSDVDRMFSFSESYKLGINLIKGVHSSHLASLDAKLMPEHLFYLYIDFRTKFLSSYKSANRYNFYKDSNTCEIEQMLKVLAPLRQHILSLLNEWEEQNDLQNFLNVIDMLLTLPSNIPLAKVVINDRISSDSHIVFPAVPIRPIHEYNLFRFNQ